MQELVVCASSPTGSAVTHRTTSDRRSMEADTWDLHVIKTYVGIENGTCEGRVVQTGKYAPAPSEPAPARFSPESELLRRLRDEVRKRHYSSRTEDAYSDWV